MIATEARPIFIGGQWRPRRGLAVVSINPATGPVNATFAGPDVDVNDAFAGAKESGIGSEKGRDGMRTYAQEQNIYWGMNTEPLSWAAVHDDGP